MLMKVLIVDNQTDTLPELKRLLESCNLSYDVIDPDSIEDAGYSLVILSGGIWHTNDRQNLITYNKELEFIRNTNTPIIGICLGMLLISLAHGTNVRYIGRRTGDALIEWETGQANIVYENHSMAIQNVPYGFTELAKSKMCIEIIRHESKPVIGLQFHPEFSPGTNDGIAIFKSLLKEIAISF